MQRGTKHGISVTVSTDPGPLGQRNSPPPLNRPAESDVLPSVPSSTPASSERLADDAFIRALYAEHGGALLRYALHLTGGDRQRAEDLVQETIVRAWRHPDALSDRPARPWLFAVARNLAVDAHRARQARTMVSCTRSSALCLSPLVRCKAYRSRAPPCSA